jgi:hypothetical protein
MDHELILKSIQSELDSQLTGRWSSIQLTTRFRGGLPINLFSAVWRIELNEGDVSYPNISFLCVAIDKHFPRTQPVIWLPEYQHGKSKHWPHIDSSGALCLPRSSMKDDPAKRVIQHLVWAEALLNMDPVKRREDFSAEVLSYWAQSHNNKDRTFSLLSLKAENRIIFYCGGIYRKTFVADTAEELVKYVLNLQGKVDTVSVQQGYLIWLDTPWTPDEFPEFGGQLIKLVPFDVQDRILVAGKECLIIIGANTKNGIVFLSAYLKSTKLAEVRRGFRVGTPLPASIVRRAFHANKIHKMDVARVDGAWVHGRDHNFNYESLCNKRVAICGCGSLGASIARLLVQAGVGTLHLIDGDRLAAYNASRHLLGVGYAGAAKVEALRNVLLRDFPHMRDVTAHNKNIEALSKDELALIQAADVIVSAGINIQGDLYLDDWRRKGDASLVHVCTWVEAFAVAGHAAALFGSDSVNDMFDDNMDITFRLCDVPAAANHMVTMAGCGDAFQPHGAVELQSTVNIAARLIIDILSNQINASMRRTWFGSRNVALQHNLMPRASFEAELCARDFSWP